MSVTTTSTDPVQTIIDILDGTSPGGWPGGTKPTNIEKQWETDFQTKTNRADPSVYVWSPEDGPERQFGRQADTKIQTETIDADTWAVNESDALSISGDVISILEDYWNEGKSNTEWNRIRPERADDRRAETLAMRTDHYVISVRIQLEREGSMGT